MNDIIIDEEKKIELQNLLLDIHSRAILLKYVNDLTCSDVNELIGGVSTTCKDIISDINKCLELLQIFSNSNTVTD